MQGITCIFGSDCQASFSGTLQKLLFRYQPYSILTGHRNMLFRDRAKVYHTK